MLPIVLQYGVAGCFGLIIGSFITVVVHRLPMMIMLEHQSQGHRYHYNLWLPRSCCALCQHPLTLSQNLPLIGYLWLRGRCAFCSSPINICYPVIEFLSAGLAITTLWRFGACWQAFATFGLVTALLALAFIDAKTYLLPDAITLPLIWSGLVVNLIATFTSLRSAVIGAVAGYLCLWSVYWIFRFLRKEEGIGYGDFKLLSALGAWLGWTALPQILLFASTVGLLFGLMSVICKKSKVSLKLKNQHLPFGPFLAASGVGTLFFGCFYSNLFLFKFS